MENHPGTRGHYRQDREKVRRGPGMGMVSIDKSELESLTSKLLARASSISQPKDLPMGQRGHHLSDSGADGILRCKVAVLRDIVGVE